MARGQPNPGLVPDSSWRQKVTVTQARNKVKPFLAGSPRGLVREYTVRHRAILAPEKEMPLLQSN